MKKKKQIQTNSLKKGMRMEQPIVDREGHTLVARGSYLDDFKLNALLRRGLDSIYTYEAEEIHAESIAPETLEKIEALKVADPAKVELSQSVKKRVSEGIQFLYQNTEAENFVDTTEHIANNLMNAVLENDALAIDISTLKVSDEYTFKHSVDVATMAMVIAKKHGLPDSDIYDIGVTGLLHDVGKSKIPNEVLNKPDKLSDDEFALMKQHTLFGFQILKDKADIKEPIRLGVLQHHEKINGKGYPLGLSSDKINSYAKILAVADIYDALVTRRPYKEPFSQRDAVEIIMSMTTELDIDIMRSFLESVILYPVGSTVRLSNGESAQVVENTPDCILRPTVVGLRTGTVYHLATDVKCASIIIL